MCLCVCVSVCVCECVCVCVCVGWSQAGILQIGKTIGTFQVGLLLKPAIICAPAAQREQTWAFLHFRSRRISPLFLSMMCALPFSAVTRPAARTEPGRHLIPLRNKESPLTFPDPHQQLASFRSAEKTLQMEPLVGGGREAWRLDGEGLVASCEVLKRYQTGSWRADAIGKMNSVCAPPTPPTPAFQRGMCK